MTSMYRRSLTLIPLPHNRSLVGGLLKPQANIPTRRSTGSSLLALLGRCFGLHNYYISRLRTASFLLTYAPGSEASSAGRPSTGCGSIRSYRLWILVPFECAHGCQVRIACRCRLRYSTVQHLAAMSCVLLIVCLARFGFFPARESGACPLFTC